MQLAIVIPAYKATFLSETLHSLTIQKIKDFNVYIGDDASPEDILSIVSFFKSSLNIIYNRFDKNEGGKDLAFHWRRCINMVQDEQWIWLLPDDDVASPDCVSAFLNSCTADKEQKKLYRFHTAHIDSSSKLIRETLKCPPLESNIDFFLNKLQFKRNSSIAEYIFSKHRYYDVGGFESLPLAWGSDDLLWIKLSQDDDIFTLPYGKVFLRQSNLNISNDLNKYAVQKIEAKYLFLELVVNNILFMQKLEQHINMSEFKKIIIYNLFSEYRSHNFHFLNFNLFHFARKNNMLIGGGLLKNMYRLIRFEFSYL